MKAGLLNWLATRSSGLLLHPTCLPGDQGIGVLDHSIDALLHFIQSSGFKYWQVCPLGPTGYGNSPYQCFSSFAGNPYLIDLVALQREGLLTGADIFPLSALPHDRADFGWLYVTKWPVLLTAFDNFKSRSRPVLPYGDFEQFRRDESAWLAAYALFMALKDHFKGLPWWEWPAELRFYTQAKKSPLASTLAARAEAHAFFQYLFFGQWRQVRTKATAVGVSIIGDAPIFVARDSADVWAHPELFQLDPNSGHPLAVAGVPPDYFSADGQLWGNPLYAWERHSADGYAWWLARLRANFALCDVIRIDHFRAFDTYWSIPATAATAKTGRWQPGPGLTFFKAVQQALPDCQLIAEDLGDLTPSVHALREATGLPGMAILQFAFGGDSTNTYLPHNLRSNLVVYPGTHDNDTTIGWYRASSEKTRDRVRRYLRVSGETISWDLVRAGYASVANLAVITMPDLLGLGAEARFNTPGVAAGNWQWRYSSVQLESLQNNAAPHLHELGELYGRT